MQSKPGSNYMSRANAASRECGLEHGSSMQPGEARGAPAETEVHSPPAMTEPAAKAFSELYERHLSKVYNYLRSRTQSDEDAADLTQQTFMQALHAFPSYTERGVPVEVWLFRIARNLVVAAHRRSGKRAVDLDLLPEALQPAATGAEEPEVVALQKEARARLRTLLLGLDADKRELVVLRFVSRLTAWEIALVVGKSEAAVQKQLTRTLHMLKEQYDED